MSYKLYHKLYDDFAATDIPFDFIHSHITCYCEDMIKKGEHSSPLGRYERVILIVKYLEVVMEMEAL